VDGDRFLELVATGRPVIKAEEYALPAPDWALVGSPEQGFDPADVRHRRKRRNKNIARSFHCPHKDEEQDDT